MCKPLNNCKPCDALILYIIQWHQVKTRISTEQENFEITVELICFLAHKDTWRIYLFKLHKYQMDIVENETPPTKQHHKHTTLASQCHLANALISFSADWLRKSAERSKNCSNKIETNGSVWANAIYWLFRSSFILPNILIELTYKNIWFLVARVHFAKGFSATV